MAKATSPDEGTNMETVTSADGTEIACKRTGSGPSLVLVPGGGANDHVRWEAGGVRPALAEHCTVYAIDTRGLGQSGDADEYAFEREFEDVAAVIDSIDEPATLLGHSSGALLSMEAALRTDNLRALILYEPPLSVGDHEFDNAEAIVEMDRLLEQGQNEQVLLTFLREVAGLPPDEIDPLREAPNWHTRVEGAHTVPRQIQGVNEYELDPARFADLTVPTLLLSGSESPQWMREATRVLHETLPNSRHVTFDGHAHVAMLTATDRFIDEVLAFIREVN